MSIRKKRNMKPLWNRAEVLPRSNAFIKNEINCTPLGVCDIVMHIQVFLQVVWHCFLICALPLIHTHAHTHPFCLWRGIVYRWCLFNNHSFREIAAALNKVVFMTDPQTLTTASESKFDYQHALTSWQQPAVRCHCRCWSKYYLSATEVSCAILMKTKRKEHLAEVFGERNMWLKKQMLENDCICMWWFEKQEIVFQ